MLTPSQTEKLLTHARGVRKVEQPVGHLHAWWDIILDLEAFV